MHREFIEWEGNSKLGPIGIYDTDLVTIRLRNGKELTVQACWCDWKNENMDDDIVSYCLLPKPKGETE